MAGASSLKAFVHPGAPPDDEDDAEDEEDAPEEEEDEEDEEAEDEAPDDEAPLELEAPPLCPSSLDEHDTTPSATSTMTPRPMLRF